MTSEDFEKMKACAEAAGKRLRADEDFQADCEYWRNRPNLIEWLSAKGEALAERILQDFNREHVEHPNAPQQSEYLNKCPECGSTEIGPDHWLRLDGVIVCKRPPKRLEGAGK